MQEFCIGRAAPIVIKSWPKVKLETVIKAKIIRDTFKARMQTASPV